MFTKGQYNFFFFQLKIIFLKVVISWLLEVSKLIIRVQQIMNTIYRSFIKPPVSVQLGSVESQVKSRWHQQSSAKFRWRLEKVRWLLAEIRRLKFSDRWPVSSVRWGPNIVIPLFHFLYLSMFKGWRQKVTKIYKVPGKRKNLICIIKWALRVIYY